MKRKKEVKIKVVIKENRIRREEVYQNHRLGVKMETLMMDATIVKN